MALKQSKQVLARMPVPSALDAVSLVAIVAEYVVPVGGAAIGDVVEMGPVPQGCVPIDFIAHNSAGTASSTAAFGYLSGSYGSADGARTCGNEFVSATSIAAAALTRLAKPLTAAAQTDDTKGWGFVIAGAGMPAGQIVRATLLVAPAPIGIA